jgi:hypothetical protein
MGELGIPEGLNCSGNASEESQINNIPWQCGLHARKG